MKRIPSSCLYDSAIVIVCSRLIYHGNSSEAEINKNVLNPTTHLPEINIHVGVLKQSRMGKRLPLLVLNPAIFLLDRTFSSILASLMAS